VRGYEEKHKSAAVLIAFGSRYPHRPLAGYTFFFDSFQRRLGHLFGATDTAISVCGHTNPLGFAPGRDGREFQYP